MIIAPVTRDAPNRSHSPGAHSGSREQFGKCRRVRLTGPLTETAEQVALRELREEAGYEACQGWRPSQSRWAITLHLAGFTDERGHFFWRAQWSRAPKLCARRIGIDFGLRAFTVREIRRMIAENEILRCQYAQSVGATLCARSRSS